MPGAYVQAGALSRRAFELELTRLLRKTSWPLPPDGRARTAGDGSFEIRHALGDEELYLWAWHAEEGEAFVGPLGPPVGDPPGIAAEIRLSKQGTLVLSLSDGSGAPIPGVLVLAWALAGWGSPARTFESIEAMNLDPDLNPEETHRLYEIGDGISRPPAIGPRKGRTDHDGICRLPVPAGSSLRVFVGIWTIQNGAGWQSVSRVAIPLSPGEARPIAIALQRGEAIRGRVTDAEGRPVKTVIQVTAGSRDGSIEDGSILFWTCGMSGGDGAFEVAPFGPGPYRIETHEMNSEKVLEGVRAGAEVEIVLEPRR